METPDAPSLSIKIPQELFDYIDNRIKIAVMDAIADANTRTAPESLPDRITLKAACEISGQSKSQIYKLTMANEIPFQKFGRKLVFSRKALIEWMESRTITPLNAGDGMEAGFKKTAQKRLNKG
jgi:excisionase family DNA binding protein